MKLDNQTLLTQFYAWLKENYETDLSINEVRDIINSPFSMLKKTMASGLFTSVRFMGFGLFQVFPKKVSGALKDLQKRYESGNLPHNSFLKYHKAFTKYITDEESETIKGKDV